MCGLTGLWVPSFFAESEDVARRMAETMRHRGPDAGGVWSDPEVGVTLAHRRLSILDLSSAGAQPMLSHSGRYVISFNGEIYNHLELRDQLAQETTSVAAWRGSSDTETLLACIEVYGLQAALQKSFGMFAFALWDRKLRVLSLARDRVGEKPLYVGRVGEALVFASELKAIAAAPDFAREIDPLAVSEYLRFGYVPEPLSIYRGIQKVPPGHLAIFGHPSDEVRPEAYWSLPQSIAQARSRPPLRDYGESCAAVEDCLSRVIKSQMLSDVSLGCFLSGGIDSSLVAALMQQQAASQIKTFSIGFDMSRFNEAPCAQAVATHLNTDHTEFTVSEADALAVIPELARIYDEPFADSSQVPTVLLARLARRQVTVALSGDGGDEVFGGYNRYVFGPSIGQFASLTPRWLRWLTSKGATGMETLVANDESLARQFARKTKLPPSLLDKLSDLGGAIHRAHDSRSMYGEIVSTFADPSMILDADQIGPDRTPANTGQLDTVSNLTPAEWMMATDMMTYLPGDILVKVDRAAMSASLETRAPFLDARVVELAWRIPIASKIKGRTGKKILRDVLTRHVPAHIIERPKQGFSIPLDHWLRNDLCDWVEATLSPTALRRTGLLKVGAVQTLWQQHKAGRAHGKKLWTLLMLQSWLEQNQPGLQPCDGLR